MPGRTASPRCKALTPHTYNDIMCPGSHRAEKANPEDYAKLLRQLLADVKQQEKMNGMFSL